MGVEPQAGGGNNNNNQPVPVHTSACLYALIASEFAKYPSGVYLSYLARVISEKLGLPPGERSLYMRIRRIIKNMEKVGTVSIEYHKRLAFIKPNRVDLILNIAKQKLPSNSCGGRVISVTTLSRIHQNRRLAISFLSSKRELREEDWRYLYFLFNDYLEDVGSRIIVLRDLAEDVFLLLRYKHRFLRSRIRRILDKYDKLWDHFSRYSVGVFLTVTFDIEGYDSLYDISKRSYAVFNRLRAWIRKRVGFSPPYICVNEFQDNGRLHLHIVFFGISRIADKFTELTPELKRAGFGKINYIYKIVNRGGWVWAGKPPRAHHNPKDYLKKYLVKSLGSGGSGKRRRIDIYKIAMYWATGKRFYTHSSRVKLEEVVVVRGRGGFVFIATFKFYDLPEYILDKAINPEVYYYLAYGLPPPRGRTRFPT